MAVTLAAAYLPVLWSLALLSRADKYYGYLPLVLPVFALMVWASRDLRPGLAGRRHAVGLPLIAVAVIVLVLGRAAPSLALQSVSLVVAAVGMAVWLRGLDWARRAVYPLAFLLLLVPVPRGVFAAVTLDLQIVLAHSAAALLSWSGVPVRLEHISIHLPSVTLQIVEGCNGLRFLMGLGVLVVGSAGILVPSHRRRALLVALVVPVGVLANVVRITALGLAASWFDPELAEGISHEIISKTVWITTLVALVALAWRLGRPPALSATVHHSPALPSR